jgi:hypothetical protein
MQRRATVIHVGSLLPMGLSDFRSCGASGTDSRDRTSNPREGVMLWTIFVILLVLWLLGVVSSYTMGGFIHVLLVVAVVVALIQLIQGRRVV